MISLILFLCIMYSCLAKTPKEIVKSSDASKFIRQSYKEGSTEYKRLIAAVPLATAKRKDTGEYVYVYDTEKVYAEPISEASMRFALGDYRCPSAIEDDRPYSKG